MVQDPLRLIIQCLSNAQFYRATQTVYGALGICDDGRETLLLPIQGPKHMCMKLGTMCRNYYMHRSHAIREYMRILAFSFSLP